MSSEGRTKQEPEFSIPLLLLGLAIVCSVLTFMGMAVHHITGDMLLSICFPMVLFFVFVKSPDTGN